MSLFEGIVPVTEGAFVSAGSAPDPQALAWGQAILADGEPVILPSTDLKSDTSIRNAFKKVATVTGRDYSLRVGTVGETRVVRITAKPLPKTVDVPVTESAVAEPAV